ncbi:Na+/H+ antiporter subunit E [Halanaeroarchaeum sulfurireducens]|uniref:Multiple resistance/pH regulation related protein E n=1 Tax=Halanaeroarchaeum sulfurireducens TaxID=1604004 RepID=A0A0F7P980_9EURY|nr:Na+/H+ antiporter subunit E [Halanaeroarchaeum sulfurireducens]AKH97312.1 multiple resistance/pH regulation related protein E [Halanaeroarchaeum sulfurireducens]ALG81714.1 multiple resistance/pH regulation related protein E [Halanaeroarchaeum sulfurireducens]
MKIRRWQFAAIILTIIWLFVRGVPLDPQVIFGELLLGFILAIFVTWGFRRMYEGQTNLSHGARVLPYALVYVGTFLRELIVGNVDVAYRVLWPSMPIEPVTVYMPLRVERPTAITTIANSISLTPGTLSMDYDDEANALYVHTINGRDPASIVAPIRRWEDLAIVIFGEEADPSDPAPDIQIGGDIDGE